MSSFKTISNFTTDYKPDPMKSCSQLSFRGKKVYPKVSQGVIYRQYQVGDYYVVIIRLNEIYDEDFFEIVVLDFNLKIRESHRTPNASGLEREPFTEHETHVEFYLGKKGCWIFQLENSSLVRYSDCLKRLKNLWSPFPELKTLLFPSFFSLSKKEAIAEEALPST